MQSASSEATISAEACRQTRVNRRGDAPIRFVLDQVGRRIIAKILVQQTPGGVGAAVIHKQELCFVLAGQGRRKRCHSTTSLASDSDSL